MSLYISPFCNSHSTFIALPLHAEYSCVLGHPLEGEKWSIYQRLHPQKFVSLLPVEVIKYPKLISWWFRIMNSSTLHASVLIGLILCWS